MCGLKEKGIVEQNIRALSPPSIVWHMVGAKDKLLSRLMNMWVNDKQRKNEHKLCPDLGSCNE